MGMVYADIQLLNGGDVKINSRNDIGKDEIRQLTVTILADLGALMLTINEVIREALGIPVIDQRPSQLANGEVILLPVAGSVVVRFEGRFCTTNALVLPGESEALLGAIPMEEMDLFIHPARNVLAPVHPEGPVMSLR